MNDTSPKAEQAYLRALRNMPAWRKMQVIDGLNTTVRQLTLAGIKARHPEFSQQQTIRAAASLWFGEALAEKAYPNR
jgi:hypothetical protein